MNASSNEIPKHFIFNSELDSEMLNSLYDNDIEYACEVFARFLSETTNSLNQINQYFSDGDLLSLRRVFHKIKPTFSLVGLTPLTQLCEEIIVSCDQANTKSTIAGQYEKTIDVIARSLPLVHEELNRMKSYLS